ncbi:hypothetical protein [Trichormus azollae]|uniref:hypothetical protein n=1 Tax=Trichormus azollae TaxID=1164 RepID=UPI00165195E0|nr:hypothetical protein [Trichormus azollae]
MSCSSPHLPQSIPDYFYRVCLTCIFARVTIIPKLMEIRGQLVYDSGDRKLKPSQHFHIESTEV